MIRLNQTRCAPAFNSPKKPIYRPKQQTDRRRKPAWGREDGLLWAPEYAPKYASPTFHANTLGEMLIRQDCMRRRQVINIPEFYAGSILRVTYAEKTVGTLKFAGRVLYRDGFGLNSRFVLRNVLDNEGVELEFYTYSPVIQQIELLRLEKWLDDDLRYLRDAPKEYCTVHLDMIAEPAPPKTEELKPFTGKIRMLNPHFWNIPYNKAFPIPQNIYFEEWQLEEDSIEESVAADKKNAKYINILNHHDWRDQKKSVMKEMQNNYDRIKEVNRLNDKFELKKGKK